MPARATDTYDAVGSLMPFLAPSADAADIRSRVEASFRPGDGRPPNRHRVGEVAFDVADGDFAGAPREILPLLEVGRADGIVSLCDGDH